MIGRADEVPFVARGVAEKAAKRCAIGYENGEMKKSGAERRAWSKIWNCVKRELETVASGEGGGVVRTGEFFESEIFVERDLAIEVEDLYGEVAKRPR